MPNKLTAWVMTHKPVAAVGAGAVGAVGIGIYRKRKGSAGLATSTTASGVPTDATSAAQVVPYGGDSAGGMGYDPAAFDTNASSYAAQISQSLSELNANVAALGAGTAAATGPYAPGQLLPGGNNGPLPHVGPIAPPAKAPSTGGVAHKPPPAPKPPAKKHKPQPAHHTVPPPKHHQPPPARKKKPPRKRTTKKTTARARR